MSEKKAEVVVTPLEQNQALQTGLFALSKTHAFFAGILESLDITYSTQLPTAGIAFDSNGKKWNLLINPVFFCKKLGEGEEGVKARISILLHELYHITHKHLTRAMFMKLTPQQRTLMNVAMDMEINQYIQNLPKGCAQCPPQEEKKGGATCENEMCPGHCIDVAHYYDVDSNGKRTGWERQKAFEYYYYKLVEKFKELSSNSESDGEGEGEGGEGDPSKSKGDGKHLPKEFDSHEWGGASNEGEMMDATEELIKRAMQKQSLSFDKTPKHIQDLLETIQARRSELDYRSLILSAIKKSASGIDRVNTWTKRSRRYGNIAPGTRTGPLPKLATFIDTSGSISTQEANDFLDIIDNFLRVGHRKCYLGLWHTELYYCKPYKLGERLDASKVQSGGTDLASALQYVADHRPDLSVILTDGCYSDVDFEAMLPPNTPPPSIVFIISQDGQSDHPLKRLGITIQIPKTATLKQDEKIGS